MLPPTAQHLTNLLNRLGPNLKAVGVDLGFGREGKDGTRVIEIKSCEPSVSSVGSVSLN